MSKSWFVADWHLGVDNFKSEPFYCRPFKSKEEHVDFIIKTHNNLVKTEDLVYVIGDVIDRDAENYKKYLKLINEFNGRKILIRGNHDRRISDEEFKPYFRLIIPDQSGILLGDSHRTYYLTHYPSTAKLNVFNLVGHIHGAWKYQLNMLNVGLDANYLCPFSLERVRHDYDFIQKTDDKDIFASYIEENEFYKKRVFK